MVKESQSVNYKKKLNIWVTKSPNLPSDTTSIPTNHLDGMQEKKKPFLSDNSAEIL